MRYIGDRNYRIIHVPRMRVRRALMHTTNNRDAQKERRERENKKTKRAERENGGRKRRKMIVYSIIFILEDIYN